MPANNGRWLSSLIFLALGVFAGSKLSSGSTHEGVAALPLQKNRIVRDFQSATAITVSRGPASLPAGPKAAPTEPAIEIEGSPLEGLERVENFMRLREYTMKMHEAFEDKYLRKHFVIPRGEHEWNAAQSVTAQKIGTIRNISRYWKAKFMIELGGTQFPATAKIDLGEDERGPEGETIRHCGSSMLSIQYGSEALRAQLSVQCGLPPAARKDKLYTWGDTMYDEDMRRFLIYVMLPLPDEGGGGYFLDSQTLIWRPTEEIRWETASEVDFKG